MLSAIIVFALGSTISGVASSMNMLVAGRGLSCASLQCDAWPNGDPIAIQGLGAGTMTASVHIVLSDLVTLRDRGAFSGLMALCVTYICLLQETC